MNGNDLYILKYEKKTAQLCEKYPDWYLQDFANFMTRQGAATIYNYVVKISCMMKYCKREPKDLTLLDYSRYLALIKATSSSNRITVYAAMKKYSSFLFNTGICSDDPMQRLDRPKKEESIETQRKRENGYLTKAEIKQLLRSVEDSFELYWCGESKKIGKALKARDIAILYVFLNTGMRLSALWKLDLSSIDLENRKIITIDKGHKIQEYPLGRNVVKRLDNWLKVRTNLKPNDNEVGLFISKYGDRISDDAIQNLVKKYASCIEGKHITPHKLRATYGTQIYNATHDLYAVQSCMGHSSPKTSELYIRGQQNKSRKSGSDIMERLIK